MSKTTDATTFVAPAETFVMPTTEDLDAQMEALNSSSQTDNFADSGEDDSEMLGQASLANVKDPSVLPACDLAGNKILYTGTITKATRKKITEMRTKAGAASFLAKLVAETEAWNHDHPEAKMAIPTCYFTIDLVMKFEGEDGANAFVYDKVIVHNHRDVNWRWKSFTKSIGMFDYTKNDHTITDIQKDIVGKKVYANLTTEEYNGVERNRIDKQYLLNEEDNKKINPSGIFA